MPNPNLNRRRFLAQSAAIAAPLFFIPNRERAFASILGVGPDGKTEHAHEMQHDWLTPPKEIAWGDTHGLTQDAEGRIYVAHTVGAKSEKADAVVVFDPAGKFIRSFGADFRGGAHGLDLRREGTHEFLYHCDTRRRLVVKTTLEGEVVWSVGFPEESTHYADASKYCPTNVAFLPDGDLLVGDGYGSSYVHRYSKDGEYRRTVMGPGSGKGEVSCPHGLWVDDRGKTPTLLVADRSNARIQRFDLEFNHLGFVTEGIRKPCHFKTRGSQLLVPDLDSVVTILDAKDRVVVHLGDGHPSQLRGAPREKFIAGKFIHPHDAIFLKDGSILVAEWVPVGRITRLVLKG